MKNIVSAFMVTLILVATLIVAFDVRPVKAIGTIYIRADGSIDPPTSNITSADNITYTFTDNNYDEIVVERDNIVIDGAGYVLQGTGGGHGIDMPGNTNVTIKNIEIRGFSNGIEMRDSSSNSIIRSNIIDNSYIGIGIFSSSSNKIFENNITSNAIGIGLSWSSQNSIIENNIEANTARGIVLSGGVSSGNIIHHNNFKENYEQVYNPSASTNVWDDDYPSGGNYWSDYTDADSYKGQHQNETGSDGVWDHPYVIDGSNQDMYPLTKPFGGPAGDVDGDRDVDIFDIVRMAGVYGVEYPDPRYDRLCDMDLDGDIDIFDIVKAAVNYGENW